MPGAGLPHSCRRPPDEGHAHAARQDRASGPSATASRSTPPNAAKRDDDGAQRPPAHHRRLPAHRLRRHRSRRPAQPVPLVRPVHPAPARHPRRPDRHARAGGARGRVLHAPHPHRRRRADQRAAAGGRRHRRPTYGRDVADITDRQNVQLHWIRIEDVPAIWERLEAVGLSTTEACGDAPRVDARLPARRGRPPTRCSTPARRCARPSSTYLGDPAVLEPAAQVQDVDLRLRAALHQPRDQRRRVRRRHRTADGTAGFDLWVGGGLSTNPRFAERLGVFVRPDEVTDVWAGVTSVFRDYGYRRSRNHARLKFLMADWGPEKFRRGVAGRVPAPRAARRRRRRRPRPRTATTPACERQRDGLFSVGATTRSGPHLGHRAARGRRARRPLRRRAGAADRPAGHRACSTSPERTPRSLVDELDALGLSARPSPFRRGMIACTGIEFCKLALVETKGRAETIRAELEKRLPDFDTPITINVNGCPNSCARFQVADIGFKGMVQKGAGRRRGRLPGAPRRPDGHRGGVRPQVPRPEGDRASRRPTTSSGCCAATSPAARTARRSPAYVSRADEAWLL